MYQCIEYIAFVFYLVCCINTSTYRPNTDLTESKAGPNIVSEEEIFPRELNYPFNVQTLPPSGFSNKPNENQAKIYLGSFQIIAMPMNGGLPPGFPSTFGNFPNMFGNKNE